MDLILASVELIVDKFSSIITVGIWAFYPHVCFICSTCLYFCYFWHIFVIKVWTICRFVNGKVPRDFSCDYILAAVALFASPV